MVYNYNINSQDIIKIIWYYEKKYPKRVMYGSYNMEAITYLGEDYYDFTKIQWKKLIIKLKKDGIIYLQKHIRDQYSKYITHWVDLNKLYEKHGIFISPKNNNNINNRLISSSLEGDLLTFANGIKEDNKDIYITAANAVSCLALSDKFDRHFTMNSSGKMTYTPAKRLTATTENRDKWLANKKYRSEIKIGKGLRKIFSHQPIDVPDNIIEYFTNKIKSKYCFVGKIKIVKGEDIRKWYLGSKYSKDNTETLANSCMRHSSCQNFFDIYTENDDKIQMIIAVDDDDMLIGRAILWDTDSHGLFCDRIYGNSMTIEAIKSYARKIGAYTKYEQNYCNSKIVSSIGEISTSIIKITLNNGGFNSYPYMDTLKFTDDIDNPKEIILNSESGDYCFDSTDGGPYNEDIVTLHNGDRIHEDEARYVDRYDEYYHMDDAVYSNYHSEYILYDMAISINSGDDYAWEDCEEFIYIDSEGEYFHIDDLVYSEYHDECLYNYKECIINGIIREDESKEITIGNKTFTIHESVELEDLKEKGFITIEELEAYEESME